MILALTGATGFVGARLLDQAVAAGHAVRALTRRPQAPRMGVTWIMGDLLDPGALAEGAEALVHVAGVVNAPDRAGFVTGNIDGTRAILAAARAAGVARFVHVSSLAAREPRLSAYGWSKAQAEALVEASGLDWTIVRPPGVYGPGDMDQRDLFRAARLGIVPLPPRGRSSIIHTDDLARLLLALCVSGDRAIHEPEQLDGPLTHDAFARAIGAAVGRNVVPLHLPGRLLMLAAKADRLLRGERARLTPDRVGYMLHPDWTADPTRYPPADLWRPAIDAGTGLAATAAWYRANGLL